MKIIGLGLDVKLVKFPNYLIIDTSPFCGDCGTLMWGCFGESHFKCSKCGRNICLTCMPKNSNGQCWKCYNEEWK